MALDKDMATHTLALIITHSPKFIKSFPTAEAVALLLREDGLEDDGPACCSVLIRRHIRGPQDEMKQSQTNR